MDMLYIIFQAYLFLFSTNFLSNVKTILKGKKKNLSVKLEEKNLLFHSFFISDFFNFILKQLLYIISNVSQREIAINAYTLNNKKIKPYSYEKIGNYRRLLLIKEVI